VVLNGRYRIVGLLGRGGMGEVYRADDLKLEQPVALKFLPDAALGDTERLARFYNEARLARQVSHPAVCRVHDVDEVEGHVFLSMEFVDGEDLSTLRKRIGRLSSDKAVEIGRQVCAGLAAAHAKGVLHRDLKPANVMVDGEGRARIADFGLAGLAEAIRGDDVRSGTPAYMSPEQLEGREVTARSDLYSLGLLLFELVTGRRAFDGKTLAEVLRQRAEPPPRPSELAPGLDPRFEAAILRCLERDPQRRPASALAVAAALPGGDPLALLLAEGHTPSPEMVAAAGEAEGGMPAALAWTSLLTVGAGLLLVPWLAAPAELVNAVPHEKPAAVLEDRAREIARAVGYAEPTADDDAGYVIDIDYVRHVVAHDASPSRWEGVKQGAPPVLQFWYRQSPRLLLPRSNSGRVTLSDPPLQVSGMVTLRLDLRGRLVSFFAVPPQVERETASLAEPDFGALFAAAGLEEAAFRPVPSQWTPPSYADRRAAFAGHWPERPELKMRIEAASWRGMPVAFYPVAEWTRPEREQPFRLSASMAASQVFLAVLFVGLFAAAVILARNNLRAGRADRAGSVRLGLATLLLGIASWAAGAHHVGLRDEELGLFIWGLGIALVVSLILGLFYVALEPFVRRLWPHALISWTRLLANGPRDPLVARDLLAGTAMGTVITVLLLLGIRVPAWLAGMPEDLRWNHTDMLLGLRYCFDLVFTVPLAASGLATGTFLLLVLVRLVVRREILAAAVIVAIVGTFTALRWDLPLAWALPPSLLIMANFMAVALRFGLLAYVVAATTVDLWLRTPLTTDVSSFRGEPTVFVSVVLLAIAVYGFHGVRRVARTA
jgi:serine/threonine-protein kinase